jgi:NADPH2:quinone reductase
MRGLGATPIDLFSMSVEEAVATYTDGKGFDVVYDTLGGSSLDSAFSVVGRFGHVVSCLGWGTHALSTLSFKAATYSGVFTTPSDRRRSRAPRGSEDGLFGRGVNSKEPCDRGA